MAEKIEPTAHLTVVMMPRLFGKDSATFGLLEANTGPPQEEGDVPLYTLSEAARELGVTYPKRSPDLDETIIPVAPWNPNNSQRAFILGMRGNAEQKEAARLFFKHHLQPFDLT